MQNTDNGQVSSLLNYNGASKTTVAFEDEVKKWFIDNRKRLEGLCGNQDEARRLLLAALNAISKTPTLMECTFDSLARCLLTSAELRVFPGAMSQCAYVPFNNNKLGYKEATFILTYQGLLELLYRNDKIMDIECDVVRGNDHFVHVRGSHRRLEFEEAEGERGARVGAYCIIRLTNGGMVINSMRAHEIMAFKARSKAAQSSDSPWNSKHESDVDWMWMKTVLKQTKYVPKNGSVIEATSKENEFELDQAERPSLVRNIVNATTSAPAAPQQQPAPAQKTIEHQERKTIEIPTSKVPDKAEATGVMPTASSILADK